MRFAIALLLLASLLLPLAATAAPASAATDCQFVLGFGALRALVPSVVGECLEDEHHNAFNGDAVQRTSTGLLVWRKADNFTAFTDGHRTWINGPKGLQTRLNNQRFTWERDLVDLRVQRAGFAQSGPTVAFAVVVENRNESYAIENVPLTITAFDAADKPLAVQNSVIRVVLPAQTRGIAGTLAVPADAKVTRIEGTIAAGKFVSAQAGASFGAENAIYSGEASGKVSAEITSFFAKTATNVYVGAVAYNEAGDIIGGGSAVLPQVPAKGRASVEIELITTEQPARIELHPSFTSESAFQ